jgi:hypothetical protein
MRESISQPPVSVHRPFRAVQFRTFIVALVLGILLLSGSSCMQDSGRMARERAPIWDFPVRHFAGSALSGPTDVNLGSFSTADACEVSVTWVALERPASLPSEPLDRHVRLIVSVPADQALQPVEHLTHGIRVLAGREPNSALAELTGGAMGRSMVLGTTRGVVAGGVTVSLGVSQRSPLASDQCPCIEILVSRPADGPHRMEWAVAVTAQVEIPSTAQATSSGQPAGSTGASATAEPLSEWVREISAIEPVAGLGSVSWGLVVPNTLDRTWARSLAAVVSIQPPLQGREWTAALDRLGRDLQARTHPGSADPNAVRLDEAFAAVRQSSRWQEVLLHLAVTTGSPMAKDLLLVAPYGVADRIRKEVLAGSSQPQGPAATAWALERGAYRAVVDLSREGHLTAPLEALLILHAGQVGRDPALLGELLSQSTDLPDLRRRLIRENAIFLEDMSPAARSRALEWLAAQGKAPAGFDPLGPAKQRRAALEAATDLYD